MNQADTAWMLISTALVLLMTPALAFFYGGLVRSKNALNTMMMSFISLGFVGVLWALIGYSLALRPGIELDRRPLVRVPQQRRASEKGAIVPLTIPHMLYMAFQATFCIITAALISGAIVERMASRPTRCSSRSGRWWSTRRSRTGCGAAASWPTWARGTSPAARSCTSTPAWRRSWRRWSSAGAGLRSSSLLPHNVPSCCSAPACSGSAGSGSTPAARWRPARSPAWRS